MQRLDAAILWIKARKWANRNIGLIAIALSMLSIITACPDYRRFRPYPGVPWAAEAVDWKINHPFAAIPVSQVRNRAGASGAGILEQLEKRSYRIAIPTLARILRMNVATVLAAQQAGAVAFLGLFVWLAREALGDATSALFTGVMAATSFIGQWGFNDSTNFDGLAWLILVLLLWTRSATCAALFTLFGGFCDERVLLATPLIWLWHNVRPMQPRSVQPPVHPASKDLRDELCAGSTFSPVHWGLLIGLTAFGILRLLLGYHLGSMVSTSGMSLGVLKNNLLWLPLALFGGIKGGMVLLLAAGVWLALHRRAAKLALVGCACAPILLAAVCVYDLTRSLAFGFPSYFLAMVVLKRYCSTIELRRLTFCAALGCATFPTYWVLLKVYYLLPVVRWL